ncbi:TPA: DUF551 domain-containing protein [Escherichia coli]|nr:DUF551 domain-containing protein [Escherichia coli]
MTTFTDKELIKEIKERIGSLDVRDNIERRAYEIALASLEADPVAYIFKHPAGKLFWALTDESNKEQSDVIPVYAAPPVPVVPEEKPMPNPLKMYAVDAVAAIAEVRGWNACRAAMLQSQGNCIKDGWISCSERMPEDTKMLLAFSQGEIVAAYWNWVVNPIDYKKYRAFTYLSGNILDDVTHWMPLPEPPL